MKGKRLSYEEILKLPNRSKVWVDYVSEEFDEDVQSGIEELREGKFHDNYTNEPLEKELMAEWNHLNDVKVYEWVEDIKDEQMIIKEVYKPKTYKGSEIIHMIEEGNLKDDDIVIDNEGEKSSVEELLEYCKISYLINFPPFTIKQKPVDYITACNSGKNIRPESLKYKGFKPYTYWIGFMSSNMDSNKGREPKNPLDLINGLWEIEY